MRVRPRRWLRIGVTTRNWPRAASRRRPRGDSVAARGRVGPVAWAVTRRGDVVDRRRVTRLCPRGPHHRHRRPAQRRQVDPVQRADQERGARGELPVRDDRAQRRRRRAARPAARRCWPRSSSSEQIVPATVSFVDIAGIVRGRERGRGARQQVPRQHPRGRRDLPGDPRLRRRRRRPRRRRGRPGRRHRDDQHRADPRRPADHREGDAAAGEGGQGQEDRRKPSLDARRRRAGAPRGRHDAVRRRGRGRDRPRRAARAVAA